MFSTTVARFLIVLAGLYTAMALLYVAFGGYAQAVLTGCFAAAVGVAGATIQIVIITKEKKSNGRYRKAPEAHRAGADRGAGDSTRGGSGRSSRRAGAGMSGLPGPTGHSASVGFLDPSLFQRALRLSNASPALTAADVKPKLRPAGEFDGRTAEFAAGVVTGTRSFGIDRLGRLRGVAYDVVWKPGENVAQCLEREYNVDLTTLGVRVGGGFTVKPSRAPSHSMDRCAHGFYGYYEGSNDYYEPGRVMGVIEAYGEAVIGSRGFRASKARIVALHIPDKVPAPARALIRRNYKDVAFFDSFESMVAEFPPDDAGHGVSPDNDPDFWTREA